MTSDYDKRSQGSTQSFGTPADLTEGGTRTSTSYTGTTTGGGQSGFGQSSSKDDGTGGDAARDVRSAVGREASSARAELGSAAEQVKQGASSLSEAAREKAMEGVEKGKSQITSSLGDFTAAVRKASDELGERDQSMAAGLVRQVANGLEDATGAIEGKSLQDLTRSVATFARRQPATFLIGAALAGVALGRFARASGEHAAPVPRGYGGYDRGPRHDGTARGSESRYGDDLSANDGGDTLSTGRSSSLGMTSGARPASTPVAPPVSAGTTAPRSTVYGGTDTASSVIGTGTSSLSTGATTTRTGGAAPEEGPSDAVLGHGSGSFNPEGGRNVR